MMNLDKWNKLSPAAQKIIQGAVIEFEALNYYILSGMAGVEKATLMKEGMKFHAVPAADKFRKMAIDSAYDRMDGRLGKAGRDKSSVSKLRAAFQQ